MISDWSATTWGALAKLEYGKALRAYADDGGVPVFGTNGPIGYTDRALYDNPSVIVGRKGAYRGVHYSGEPFFVIDTAFYLVPRLELNMRWAYYALLVNDINALDSGSAIPSTSRESVYRLPVHLPPRVEQDAIAEMLGALDDKIDLNRRITQTLDSLLRLLYTGLGNAPVGGDVARCVADIAKLERTGTAPAREPSEMFTHFSIPAFDAGQQPTREPGAAILSTKFVVPPGSVLLSKLNPRIERVWVPDVRASERTVCSTEFLVFTPKSSATRAFLYGLFTSDPFRSSLCSTVTGTSNSHQRVRPDDVLSLGVPVLSQEALTGFDAVAELVLERCQQARDESQTLAELRDALLPRLISGEVRLRDVERELAFVT